MLVRVAQLAGNELLHLEPNTKLCHTLLRHSGVGNSVRIVIAAVQESLHICCGSR